MIWGVLLVFAGLGLGAGQGWARWFAIVVVDPELHRTARLSRQHPEHALVTDGHSPEHHRALRAHCALEREPGRSHHGQLTRLWDPGPSRPGSARRPGIPRQS